MATAADGEKFDRASSLISQATERLQPVSRSVDLIHQAALIELAGIKLDPEPRSPETVEQYTQLAAVLAKFIKAGDSILNGLVEAGLVDDGRLSEILGDDGAATVALPEPIDLNTVNGSTAEIPTPKNGNRRAKLRQLALVINGNEYDASKLGFTTPDQAEVIGIIPELGDKPFTSKDFFDLNFALEATEHSKRVRFSRAMAAVMKGLNLASGKVVIEREPLNGMTYEYRILEPIIINGRLVPISVKKQITPLVSPEPTVTETPVYQPPAAEPALRVAEIDLPAEPLDNQIVEAAEIVELGNNPELKPDELADPEETLADEYADQAVDAEPEAADPVIDITYHRMPQAGAKPAHPLKMNPVRPKPLVPVQASLKDRLPDCDLLDLETIFANPELRDPVDILENSATRLAISLLMDSDVLRDYRSKTVIPLRTGIYTFKASRAPLYVRDGQQRIGMDKIIKRKEFPRNRGLSAKTTSQILGISEESVLSTEIGFLNSFASKRDFSALLSLQKKVQAELSRLQRSQAMN